MNSITAETGSARTYAETNLEHFENAALLVSAGGQVRGANPRGSILISELSEAALCEITTAASRAIAADSLRLERLTAAAGTLDAVVLPLAERQGAMVLIASNAGEGAMRRALLESRQRYLALIEATSDFVWETDRQGRFVYLSGEEALGYDTREMLGRPASDFVVDASLLPYPVFQTREPVLQTDVWLQHADGHISCQAITAVPVVDGGGEWSGTRGMGRDVTEARDTERTQRQRQLRDRLLSYLADTLGSHLDPEKTLPTALSGIGLAINADGGMILKGPTGLGPRTTIMPWGEAVPEVDLSEIQQALAEQGAVDLLREGWQLIGHVTTDSYGAQPRINGAVLFWARAECGGFGDGDRAILKEVAAQVGLVLVRLADRGEIVRQSNTDSLTGLLNRRAVLGDLRRRLRRLARSAGAGTLLYIGIDKIKALNEAQGHAAGDQALLALAEILKDATRPTDLVGRIGGDEFLAWLEGVGGADAETRAKALMARCKPLQSIAAGADFLGVSIGAASYDGQQQSSLEDLLDSAEAAMREVKATTGNDFAVAGKMEKTSGFTAAIRSLAIESISPLIAGSPS